MGAISEGAAERRPGDLRPVVCRLGYGSRDCELPGEDGPWFADGQFERDIHARRSKTFQGRQAVSPFLRAYRPCRLLANERPLARLHERSALRLQGRVRKGRDGTQRVTDATYELATIVALDFDY